MNEKTKLSNDEIRLTILCEYYNAIHTEKGYGNVRDISELKDSPASVVNANLIYLIDKVLLKGQIKYVTGGIIPFASRITASGIDIVEEIVKQSEDKLEADIASQLKKENVTANKVLKFTELCVKTASMCQTAVSVTHDILAGLGG